MNLLIINLLIVIYYIKKLSADNWAFLVAGSAGYYNYRHQADIAHANYYLHSKKFDMDRIIIMSYDDVPRDEENPFYNQLINMPDGPNKYRYMRIDYSQEDVTSGTFYAVMDGNITALRTRGTGRFLDVKKNDSVLIYMTDHGGSQLFAMPNDEIDAKELVDALKRLKQRCARILVVVEACESGSLFLNLLKKSDIGILAVTAANESQSSYAIYLDETRNTFLGDEFSTAFLEALDRVDQRDESLKNLFKIVKLETLLSEPQIFGDRTLLNLTVAAFIPYYQRFPSVKKQMARIDTRKNSIKSNQVQIEIAKRTLAKIPGDEHSLFVLMSTETITALFEKFKKSMLLKGIDVDKSPTGFKNNEVLQCYKDLRKHLFKIYAPASKIDATLPYLRYLNSACRGNITTDEIKHMLEQDLLILNI